MRSIYIGAVIVLAVFGLVAWQFDTTTPAEPAHVETLIAEKSEIACRQQVRAKALLSR